MGPIPHSKERIRVKIKFECRPVLMFYGTLQVALDRLCVRLNMYLVNKQIVYRY